MVSVGPPTVTTSATASPSARCAARQDAPRARALLLVSLFYLPLYFALVLIDPVVRG